MDRPRKSSSKRLKWLQDTFWTLTISSNWDVLNLARIVKATCAHFPFSQHSSGNYFTVNFAAAAGVALPATLPAPCDQLLSTSRRLARACARPRSARWRWWRPAWRTAAWCKPRTRWTGRKTPVGRGRRQWSPGRGKRQTEWKIWGKVQGTLLPASWKVFTLAPSQLESRC